jgi:hypothetical protein
MSQPQGQGGAPKISASPTTAPVSPPQPTAPPQPESLGLPDQPGAPKPPLAANAEQTRQQLREEIDRIDNMANVATDNGLFSKQKTVLYDDIQKYLYAARKNLENNQYPECETNTSVALHNYSRALYSTSRLWRFSNVYGGPVWIYLILFLSAVLAFYIYFIDAYLVHTTHITQAAVHAATWGIIGSILRGMWYLKDSVDDRQYRIAWRIYFISVPFLGGIFGGIIYLIIVAGLLSFNGMLVNPNTPNNPLVIIPIAAFAGFNWEWALAIFKRIGDLLSPTAPTPKRPVT